MRYTTCSGGVDPWVRVLLIAMGIVLIVVPIVVAVHLGREAARRALPA